MLDNKEIKREILANDFFSPLHFSLVYAHFLKIFLKIDKGKNKYTAHYAKYF